MPITVLVFAAGTEIGLEIHRSLAPLRDVEVIGAGVAGPNHGPFVFRRWYDLPSVSEPEWIAPLNALIADQQIDFVFPAHDDAVLALAEQREAIGAGVLTSPFETCRITRSKRLTYEHLRGIVAVPHVHLDLPAPDAFPVFVKPDRGQGSQLAEPVPTPDALECWARRVGASWENHLDGWVCTELLPGEEYTVDCLTDREQGLRFVGARARVRTRNGISVSTRAVDDPALEELARRIDAAFDFHGAWFFQAKRSAEAELKLLEVAPRIAGMMGFHRSLGINLPLLTIYEAKRLPMRILASHRTQVVADRALATRYAHDLDYQRVYLDLDDTLLTAHGVDPQMVRFVFQCVNRGIEVVLLTRHAGDLAATLAASRLQGIFDRIIHVPAGHQKSDEVDPRRAIFVDDSFSERAAVADRYGIPTFDVTMLEMLLDDRA